MSNVVLMKYGCAMPTPVGHFHGYECIVPVSTAEVAGALLEHGAGEVRGWCSVHDVQSWDGSDRFCLLHPGDPEERSCQMERVLVVPFELEQFATGGQTP